jgi:hypothetical protein
MRPQHETPVHERIDSLVMRVNALEQWMEDFKLKWADTVNEIKANTRLTEEIHGDTKDIIDAVRWISTTKKVVVAVFVGVSGAAGAILACLQALKGLGIL